MRRFICAVALCASLAAGVGCQQLTDLETKVDQNTSDIKTLKEQVAALQSIVNAGYVITETKEIEGGYEFTLSNGKKITVTNGKDGDSFFGSVIVDTAAGIVKIVLTDGPTFNVPLAQGIVSQVNQLVFAPEYEDLSVTFNYFDETSYDSIRFYIGVLPVDVTKLVAYNREKVDFMVAAFCLQTRAPSGITLGSKVTFDEESGSFLVEADPKDFINEFGLETPFCLAVMLTDSTHQVMTQNIPVYRNCTALDYGGEKYHIVTLADGQTWMAENLRYVPDGFTVSDDPSDGDASIFYPYTYSSIKRDTTYKSGAISAIKVTGTPEARKDEESIKKLGLLYTYDAIFGGAVIPENYMSFEGVKGICPEGWHIPTRDDWFSLIGNSLKCYGEAAAPADDPNAVFYNSKYKGAKVDSFNAAGFNFVLGGAATVSTARAYGNLAISDQNSTVAAWYDMPALSYYASSTASPTSMMFMAAATTFTLKAYPEGRVSIMQAKANTGMSVRCVKD